MFTAKPFLNNNLKKKTFDDIKKAVAYLEEVTGFEMSFEVDKKKKKQLIKNGMPSIDANDLSKTYDWELVGKLIRE